MNKYQNGKIYKLFCNESNLVYYGSTTQSLNDRLCQHRTNKKGTCISKIMINPQIELLEDFPCNTKKELEVRERFYIENNECINMKIPGRTNKEWIDDNKEIFKQKRKEVNKNYREKNKEIIECECGKILSKLNLTRHKKSKKHLEFEAK